MQEQGFTSLNRYKEKCFPVKPLMRKLHAQGKLTGPAAELMEPLPYEQLYDTEIDPHEINNLAESSIPENRRKHKISISCLGSFDSIYSNPLFI